MAKYRVETTNGTYEVETEEPSAPRPVTADANELLAKQGIGPTSVPRAPLPNAAGVLGVDSLDQTPPSPRKNPRTGLPMRQGSGPLAITDSLISGPEKMAQGAEQIANVNADANADAKAAAAKQPPPQRIRKTPTQQLAGGASKIIRGGMETATPLLPAAAVSVPYKVAGGLITGSVASEAASGGLRAMGAPEEVADFGGDVAGIAAGTKAARMAPAKGENVSLPTWKEAIGTRRPIAVVTKEIMTAVRPPNRDYRFRERIPDALDALAQENELAGDPLKSASIEDAGRVTVDLAKRAESRAWENVKTMMGTDSPVADLTAIGRDARARLRTTTNAEDIANLKDIDHSVAAVRDYYKSYSPRLDRIQSDLATLNAKLQRFYATNPALQSIEARRIPEIAKDAELADAMRTVFDSALDMPGDGAAAKLAKRQYGAVRSFRSYLEPRIPVAERQAQQSLAERGANILGVGKLIIGGLAGKPAVAAAGLGEMAAAKLIADAGKTGSILRRIIRNHEGRPAPIQIPETQPPTWAPGPLGSPNMQGTPNISPPVEMQPNPRPAGPMVEMGTPNRISPPVYRQPAGANPPSLMDANEQRRALGLPPLPGRGPLMPRRYSPPPLESPR